MSQLRRRVGTVALALVVVVAVAPSAWAGKHRDKLAAANAVTLEASRTTLTIGDDVRLSGAVDPPSGGESVDIVDGSGTVIATVTTGSQGGFHLRYRPTGTVTLHASWQSLDSPDVTVRVRSIVTVRMGSVRLFDVVHATGHVRPARPGEAVTVDLLRDGHVAATHHATMRATGSFRTAFRAMLPGTYRVRATFSSTDLLRGSDVSGAATTPLPSLSVGSHGVFVKLLEQRLRALHYHLTRIDMRFDFRTADAVLAFRKVQRMPRNGLVTSTTWRALASPRRLHPRGRDNDFHIEIDQTRQVVFTVEQGEVTGIIHTSTGKPSTPTYDGHFHVVRKLAGYSEHGLYYPSYFDGNRAIHGWPDVPTYPASHGCSRVPMWTARWIYGLAPIGTPVIVYHE